MMESIIESIIESHFESSMKSIVKSILESIMESVMGSIMESVNESTVEFRNPLFMVILQGCNHRVYHRVFGIRCLGYFCKGVIFIYIYIYVFSGFTLEPWGSVFFSAARPYKPSI